MEKKLNLFCLLAVLFLLTPKIAAQCTSGTRYPTDTYQATTEAGASIINTDARTGQYATVHVLPSKEYTFSSSVATDYITVTNDTGTEVYASGVTPVDYVTIYNQTLRYYIHQNDQCATTNQFVRTRSLSWRVAPPCLEPVPTGVANITPISCTINYTEPSVVPRFGYEAYVSTSSETPGFTVPTSDSTTSSIFVTNLNPDTTYHYWLRSDCLYRKGAWVYGGTFNTISALVCNSAYYGLYPATTFTPTCTGSYELFTEQSSRSSTYSNIAVVPNTQYSFRTSFPNDFLTITNALGTAVFTSGIDEVTWNSGEYSGVVRFYAHDNAQCRYNTTTLTLRSKSVKCVTTSLTCLPPTSLAISNITSNSVRMGWTAPATAPSSGYQIYLVTNNTAPGVTTTPTHTSTTAGIDVVSGLTAGVTYYYWVRSNCGTDKSPWASGGSFTVNASLSCNSATNGLYPNATFTPSCTGSAEPIATNAFASQYSNINAVSNIQYTFSSSVATDYITITNAAGTAVLANGVTPLTWSSNTTGVVRYYLHANANCGAQNSNRTKSIQCTAAAGTCGVPTSLAVSNITSNSCRMTWNAPATAPASYDLYIVTTNTAPTANTAATVTSATARIGVLSGVAPATTYYYWIRSNCGTAKSAWVSGGSFTTIAALVCNGAANGLYPDATFTPSCTGNAEQIASNAYAGEYSNVNVVANKQYTFTSSVATDYLTITNAAGTVVLASGVTPLNWASGTTAGVVRYYLSANANCGAQETSRIRSIRCVDATTTTCGVPTSLAVSNITSNSCRMTWNAPATAPASYDLYIVTTNTAPTANTTATVTSTTAGIGVLSGVAAATTYYYWIRSNCGTAKSAWVSGGSFTTIAALVCNGAANGLYPNATFTPSCTGNAEQIASNAYAGEYSNVNVLANKQYTFTSSIATDYLTITNAAGTIVLASGVTPLNWASATTAGVVRYYLSANANCGAQETSRIRSIRCVDAPVATCNAPTQFWSDAVTATAATLGWIPSTSAPNGGYLYVYNTSQTIGGIDGNTSSTSADLTGLLPNTTYHWWVAANCVTSQSQWAYGGSFTTLSGTSSCNAPTQFWSDAVTSTSATLGWIPSTSAPNGGYLYVYNTSPTIGGTDGSSSSTSADLTGLLPNTTYYWWVAANCVTSQSQWASGGSFTTLPQAATGCWKSIATGSSHTLGIMSDGTLWAWGANDFGQLGDGTRTARRTPVKIGTASDWQSVSAGTFHTMAIKTNGTLWGWGINGNGRLGDGTDTDRIFPGQVGSSTNWQRVCAGDVNTLAIKTDGTLWAWGYNGYAQFGDGTSTSRGTPYQIGTATNWQSVDTGNLHTIATKTNGTLWAWGTNTYGQVGDGTTAVRFSPVQIGTETNWKSIAAGENHSVALKTNGVLYTWGHNQWGQLGDNTNISKSTPAPIFDQVQNIDAAGNHTVGTTTYGNRFYTGINTFGQLGDGTTGNRNGIQVTNSNNHRMIIAGSQHTISLDTDGSITACGANGQGQFGNGTIANSTTMVAIACPRTLSVDDLYKTANAVKVYPNPVKDLVNITSLQTMDKVSVFNILGQEVLKKSLHSNEGTLDFSKLPSGTYLVKVTADNEVKTVKVIKQ